MSEEWERDEAPLPARRGNFRPLWITPLIGMALGWVVGSVIALVDTKKFESRLVLQIHPPGKELSIPGSAVRALGPPATENAIANEVLAVTAPETLKLVVERLDLCSRWELDRVTSVKLLEAMVTAEPIEGTDCLVVTVRHPSAGDARDCAAEIANAYIQRRNALETERAQKALAALDAELRDYEDLVEERRKVLDTIIQAMGVPYVEGVTNFSEVLRGIEDVDEQIDRSLEMHDLVEARRDYESSRALLQDLEEQHVRERINLRIPRNPVTIHERPTLGVAPVTPRVAWLQLSNSLGWGVLGLVLGLVIALTLRLSRSRQGALTSTAPAS